MVEVVKKIKKAKSEPISEVKVKQEAPKKEAKKNTPPTKPKKTFYKKYLGQRLVFQLKSGSILEGDLESEDYVFLKVANAIITGKNYKTKVEWVNVDRSQIGHFHPVTTDIEPI